MTIAQPKYSSAPTSRAEGGQNECHSGGRGTSSAPEHNSAYDLDDSIADYMADLLARSRRSNQTTTSSTTVPAPVRVQPAPPPEPDVPTLAENETTLPEAVTLEPVATRPARPRPNKNVERASIDAFRELANFSARSAVAKHQSASLRGRYMLNITLTTVLFGITLLLLTAHIWSDMSFVNIGMLAATATCVSGVHLVQMVSRVQTNQTIYGVREEEPDGETAE